MPSNDIAVYKNTMKRIDEGARVQSFRGLFGRFIKSGLGQLAVDEVVMHLNYDWSVKFPTE
jgi:hypothetical protein